MASIGLLSHSKDSVSIINLDRGLKTGAALATEMSVLLRDRFRLNAGFHFSGKVATGKQVFQLNQLMFREYWSHRVYALETPVRLSYLAVDRRWQILISAGLCAANSWHTVKHNKADYEESRSGTLQNVLTDYTLNPGYSQVKRNLALSGECSIEIIPGFSSRFSLCLLMNRNFRNHYDKIGYKTSVSLSDTNQPFTSSSHSGYFNVSQPAYFSIQIKYTFRKNQDSNPENNADFNTDETAN